VGVGTEGDGDVRREILAALRSIDAKLSPPTPPTTKPGNQFKPGRVFSAGQTIPGDVDLVIGSSNLRWKRVFDDMQVGQDQWYPRDVEGPILSGGELIRQSGHVTEVPAPDSEART
jgi:hypothetical protein